ncbi:PadR family transcriptional regulator [archaeon]|nr:MAG: PadR family transcriptional regulator [archaeon]
MQKKVPENLMTYLILDLIRQQPRYGYEIVKELEHASNDHWELSYGTVYGTLNRLEQQGILERIQTEEERKYFGLTKKGEEFLEGQEAEIKELGVRSREVILGFLNIYRNIHGREHLERLLDDIQEEFKKE